MCRGRGLGKGNGGNVEDEEGGEGIKGEGEKGIYGMEGRILGDKDGGLEVV